MTPSGGRMPSIYLSADAVLHVEVPWTAVPTDGEEYEVEVLDLVGAEMRTLGTWVQVSSRPSPSSTVAPFDLVVSVDGRPVHTLDALQEVLLWSISSTGNSGKSVVRMRRAPFGLRNQVPSAKRGWVYLERFITMVKMAMVT